MSNSLVFQVSPSDLTFGWNECQRCLYLKIRRDLKQPRIPMPAIFTNIDREMKHRFMDRRTGEGPLDFLPPGLINSADGWVESKPLALPGTDTKLILRGRYDTTARLDDGSHAIIDFKTSVPRTTSVDLYSRQLHAYALALENPGNGKLRLAPITRMGLLCFSPTRFADRAGLSHGIQAYFGGGLEWKEVPRDDARFLTFLAGVARVLEGPDPPPAAPGCPYCEYLSRGLRMAA